MKIDLHPLIDERERFFVPISEFSFTASPVHIHHAFRCLPTEVSSPNQPRNPRRNMLSRRISQLIRWMCGKPTAPPATGDLLLEQSAP
jgi:hypothetical protein